MKLIELEGKTIRILDTDNRLWEGKVTDYIYPEDNEPEEIESIIIKCSKGRFPGKSVEFIEKDIKSIEIIK